MSEIIAKTAIVGGGADTSVTIDATNLSKDSECMFFFVFLDIMEQGRAL